MEKFQPSRTIVTSLQFEQDGDVVTADSDGFITIYSVDSDGAYFVRMEFEVCTIYRRVYLRTYFTFSSQQEY